jgi:hypothetical protein
MAPAQRRCAADITTSFRRWLPPPLIFVFADFISLMLSIAVSMLAS